VVSLVVVPSGQVGCASGVGPKAQDQPCPAAAKLRLIGYRNCAALRSQAATALARGEERSDERVDEITGIRFVREPYPFPSFACRARILDLTWSGGLSLAEIISE
jgi:hypothetical protein